MRGTSLDALAIAVMNAGPIFCPTTLGRDAALTVMRSSDVKPVANHYLEPHQKLRAMGALGLLSQCLKTSLIAMNSDLLTAVNFSSMLEFHVEHRATATTAVREHTVENPRHSCFVDAGMYQRAFDVL